jgi:hypothetical protein
VLATHTILVPVATRSRPPHEGSLGCNLYSASGTKGKSLGKALPALDLSWW